MSNLERAIILATRAHAGQIDRSGQPYILHPLRVMLKMSSEEARIVAVLHDVLEDTDVTAHDLAAEGFSEEIVEAVQAMSRQEDEDYEDFVLRAKQNSLARTVKMADIEDNMDPSRNVEPSEKDMERLSKYGKALDELMTETENAR
ncbi:HD domain-containing protein [Paenibacillus bovis]|uniref:GTP pyrophosphokinase n=1 Tax=Paenibacillus bovis TaxID=1616788 RepID=A0A172ZFD9_9BACL|nr:HD domain-containing protein [Paenibacillus bovis]ANF96092.1 GTP pyrophosphokinase [Paenibacillus bovis]